MTNKASVAVVVLNWNDSDLLPHSVGSLLKQSEKCDIIVVDNGSDDDSRITIESFGNKVTALFNAKNLGFAGGVNRGITYALSEGYEYIGLLNNDATADKDWVKHLVDSLRSNKRLGGATSTMVHKGDKTFDSTGDFYTIWGLPYPRGRGEPVSGKYNKLLDVTAISGGASMFRADFFTDVGLFDDDFFAYYEDVDLGLRGKLRGWDFAYSPDAKVLHDTGSTSGRVKGFSTYQTMKNLPWLIIKNVPLRLLPRMTVRFSLAYFGFIVSAASRKQLRYAVKGWFVSLVYTPKKLVQRLKIQHSRKITTNQFNDLIIKDLPPNADKLWRLRARYLKLRRKK